MPWVRELCSARMSLTVTEPVLIQRLQWALGSG